MAPILMILAGDSIPSLEPSSEPRGRGRGSPEVEMSSGFTRSAAKGDEPRGEEVGTEGSDMDWNLPAPALSSVPGSLHPNLGAPTSAHAYRFRRAHALVRALGGLGLPQRRTARRGTSISADVSEP